MGGAETLAVERRLARRLQADEDDQLHADMIAGRPVRPVASGGSEGCPRARTSGITFRVLLYTLLSSNSVGYLINVRCYARLWALNCLPTPSTLASALRPPGACGSARTACAPVAGWHGHGRG